MKEHIPNIVLVGFMGTGKTTVGITVAKHLNREFLDMDHLIEERQNKPVSDIFAQDGEAFFRTLEHDLAIELSCQSGLIIGAGGGIVLNPENISTLASGGIVICLWASPETIVHRLAADTSRPLLTGDDKLARIQHILNERIPLYRAIPFHVNTDNLTADQVASDVLRIYNETVRNDTKLQP